MRRLIFVELCLAALLAVSPAHACINDREVQSAEREFRSSYMDQTPSEPVSPGEIPEQQPASSWLITSLGGALLASAFTLGLIRSYKRS